MTCWFDCIRRPYCLKFLKDDTPNNIKSIIVTKRADIYLSILTIIRTGLKNVLGRLSVDNKWINK
jgi:hypothetical protein